MLASNQYRFSQRLGEGLIGGAAAYGKQQEFEQKNQQQAQLMGLKKQEMGFTEREVALKEAEQKRRIDAAKAAAAALSGNVAPVQPSAPVPTAKTTVAPPPIPSAGGVSPPVGGLVPPPVEDKDKTQAAPIPSPNNSFWENVDPQSNPHNLLALADRFDQAAAAAAEDPSSMASYRASAQQYRAQANAIRQSGIVTMKDQSTASMPGFNEAKAAQAAALKKAELDVTTSPEMSRAEAEKARQTEQQKALVTRRTTAGTEYTIDPTVAEIAPKKPQQVPSNYKAEINPDTGAVKTMPVSQFLGYAETGGHPIDPNLIGQKAVLKSEDKYYADSVKNSTELEKQFESAAEKAQEGIATLIKFSTAAKVLESGGLNMNKAEYANFARGLGFDTLADQIMSMKDTAAAYNAVKTNVDQAINQVTNSFAKPTQAEFLTTEKKSTPSIDSPADSSHSLTQTRLAGLLWQNSLSSDWEKAKTEGVRNFSAFQDAWKRAHPHAMFEEAANRALGNFKGQDLPKPEKVTEGVTYVVPKYAMAEKSELGQYLLKSGFRPGDIVVAKNVNHAKNDAGDFVKVSPTEAYKIHLNAPALTYGGQ
jgi:hypothetical protein